MTSFVCVDSLKTLKKACVSEKNRIGKKDPASFFIATFGYSDIKKRIRMDRKTCQKSPRVNHSHPEQCSPIQTVPLYSQRRPFSPVRFLMHVSTQSFASKNSPAYNGSGRYMMRVFHPAHLVLFAFQQKKKKKRNDYV